MHSWPFLSYENSDYCIDSPIRGRERLSSGSRSVSLMKQVNEDDDINTSEYEEQRVLDYGLTAAGESSYEYEIGEQSLEHDEEKQRSDHDGKGFSDQASSPSMVMDYPDVQSDSQSFTLNQNLDLKEDNTESNTETAETYA